jgi:D-alanyl-D-alanine carboxypeptidase
MVSTTSDLIRFFQALLRGRLLPPDQQHEMFTTVATPEGMWIPNTTYGLGVSSITLSCSATVWGMGGAINGSLSYTYGTRDGRHMAAQNVNGDWNDPIDIFTQVLEAEFCRDGA